MRDLDQAELDAALRALGTLLESRGKRYELVAVGGGSLILRGLATRPTTKDLDLLGAWIGGEVRALRPLPEPLHEAIVDVARAYGLADDWINVGPDSLLDLGLPEGFGRRIERIDYGGLILWLAGRLDMICFKLYAAVDQGLRSRHRQDLGDLKPTRDELIAAAHWASTHDPSPGFRAVLLETLLSLGVEIDDGQLG